MEKISIEYKGEAFGLEKGKLYIIKVKVGKLSSGQIEHMFKFLKDEGYSVTVLVVSDMDDVVIELKDDGENKE